MSQYATYQERSRAFLDKAYAELEEGDLLQASEKGWGAAVQILKAIAAERGWEHHSHRLLYRVLNRLVAETGSERLRLGFIASSTLHANFYEDWLERAVVEENLNRVQAFVEAEEGLLNGR